MKTFTNSIRECSSFLYGRAPELDGEGYFKWLSGNQTQNVNVDSSIVLTRMTNSIATIRALIAGR